MAQNTLRMKAMRTEYDQQLTNSLSFDLKQTATKNRAVGLWRMMTGYRWLYLGALLSVALGAAARTATYLLLQYVVDDVLTQGLHLEWLPWLALGVVGLAGAGGVF